MPLVQVRDVPEQTVAKLKAHAADRGLTLAAFIRAELERIADRPTNADVFARIDRGRPRTGPQPAETVRLLRRLRETS